MDKKKKIIIERSISIGLFLLCMAVHLCKISQIPFGIHVDEMGMGYDAWCLRRYGVDRYLNSYPAYLINFGGGQSALYAYLCSLVLWFTELSAFSIRLPGIIVYLIGVIYQCRLASLWDSKKEQRTRLTLFFMAILPVYIMLFRIGMDCNLMLAASSIVFFYLVRAVKEEKKKDFVIAGISVGILLYTYAISYIVMLAFLCMMLPYLFYVRKLSISRLLCLGIPMGLLALPLILTQLINMFDLKEINVMGVTLSKFFFYRGSDISIQNLSVSSILDCMKCIFCYDTLPYNSVAEFGTVYYVSIPFVVMGLIKSMYEFGKGIRNRIWKSESIFVVWFLILFVCGCCMEPNVNRLNGIYVAVVFFLVEGVICALSFIKVKKVQRSVLAVLVMIYGILFVMFLSFYFGGKYEERYEPLDFFNYPLEEALEEQDRLQVEKDKTVYIGELNQTYIYYMGSLLINPYEYHAVNVLDESNHESISEWGKGIGKYRFYLPESIDFRADYIVGKDDVAYCERLEQAGFVKAETEHYYIYQFTMDCFERIDNTEVIQWNAGVNEENSIILEQVQQDINGEQSVVLVGWSYNIQDMVTWEVVYITVGENEYIAEVVERPDVVDIIGNKELLHTGILFVIQVEELKEQAEIVITCMDAKNRKYCEQMIKIR